MRIERLEVENFRGFKERTFTFGPGMNVLVGDNGAGKTAALLALRAALGEGLYQSSIVSEKERSGYFTEDDIRWTSTENASTGMDEYNPAETAQVTAIQSHDPSRADADFASRLSIRRSRAKGLPHHDYVGNPISGLEPQDRERRNQGEAVTLPIIAYYGTWRTDLKTYPVDDLPKWRDGYARCLDSGINLAAIERWFRDQRLVEADRKQPSEMYRTISAVMKDLIPGMTDLRYHSSVSGLQATFESGQRVAVRHLSDGFRTAVAMYADLATRIAILNPSLGANALDQTPGVVLIDELDLHLHPKWQRRIANDLARAFPTIQFITTTHSPQIVSEMEPEDVQVLTEEGAIHPEQAYGMESDWIVENVMGGDSRKPKVAERIHAVFKEAQSGNLTEAKELLEKLKVDLHGTDADLSKAEAVITRKEMMSDA